MPDGSPRITPRSTFDTLTREKNFKSPPKSGHVVPILNEFVTPHLESFNALFDDSGLPQGDEDGRGLLSLGITDIGERVVFDGKGQMGEESGQAGWGNRLTSAYSSISAENANNIVQYGMSR
jgi:DNA-directed RNA polymerase I subunit RPA2